jgi:uncharacterized membrane protein YkvA (DUF1232 family)
MWKRLTVLWVLVRGDARRLWYALRHPDAPVWLRPVTALLLLYLVSPFDLIPDALPIIGIVDDLVLLPLAVGWMLSMLPGSLRDDIARRFGSAAPIDSKQRSSESAWTRAAGALCRAKRPTRSLPELRAVVDLTPGSEVRTALQPLLDRGC